MDNIKCNAYIFFNGNCKEAMEFYKSIFGGELSVMTYDDVPADTDEAMKGKVMHASLAGGVADLMASDTQNASPKAAKISICLGGEDQEKLTSIFNRLSEDVEVQYPLKKEFWGDIFGTVVDKYGVEWMVNISVPKA